MAIKFLDTSSLLLQIPVDFFYFSNITLSELENIKNSANKDYEIKQKARLVSRFIMENYDKNRFKIVEYNINQLNIILDPEDDKLKVSNDLKILSCATWVKNLNPESEFIFFTNDINLFNLARSYGLKVQQTEEIKEDYTGCLEVTLNDDQMAEYYSHLNCNMFNLYRNEYLIIKNQEDEVVDVACWDGSKMRPAAYDDFTSPYFGRVKPKRNDPYQICLFDSLSNNQVTLISGKAGSGKSYIALSYLFSLLDKKIDRIVVFCNPVVARSAARLGYYPGSVVEKLLSTQVGAILSSKLGSQTEVEKLIDEGKIVLVPIGDARGYEVPQGSALYITEAQNFNIELLRLALQRANEDTKVIIEGDAAEQTDLDAYAGDYSGVRAMSKVFRGDPEFGQIELKNIYRSHTATLADKMGRA